MLVLTRLLEEVFTPRINRDSDSVMVVNVGLENGLKHKTLNSLRYGSMFSSFHLKTNKTSSANGSSGSSSRRGGVRSRSRSGVRGSLMETKMRMKREMEEQQEKQQEQHKNE